MLKRYSLFIIVFLSCLLIMSMDCCKKLFPPETVPCYGHMDSIGIKTNYAIQGTASSKITCAWVYVDDQPVGTFEMPCTFPMVSTGGSHTISIYPGITVDGMPSSRAKYPFFTYYDSSVTITQGQIAKFKFTTTYNNKSKFDWMEDFENPTFTIKTDTANSDTNMFKVGEPDAFEGNGSGGVLLDSTNPLHYNTKYLGISDTMSLPDNGTPVFLEMNYNASCAFTVGIYIDCINNIDVDYNKVAVEYVNPSTGWQKMYIDLGSVALADQAGPFLIYFQMARPYGVREAKLLLDNIKVIQLKGA